MQIFIKILTGKTIVTYRNREYWYSYPGAPLRGQGLQKIGCFRNPFGKLRKHLKYGKGRTFRKTHSDS